MECTNRCKFRYSVNFNPPAFVVCEMKMKIIDLVAGEHIYQSLHILGFCEIPGHIQHKAPVSKIRPVLNINIPQRAASTVPAQLVQGNIGI